MTIRQRAKWFFLLGAPIAFALCLWLFGCSTPKLSPQPAVEPAQALPTKVSVYGIVTTITNTSWKGYYAVTNGDTVYLEQSRALAVPAVVPSGPRWTDWGFDNSQDRWAVLEVQRAPMPLGPWTVKTNGLLGPLSTLIFRSWETNGAEFYRVAIRWL